MPAGRIAMVKLKELLRLNFDCKLSQRQIARALGISKGAVGKYVVLAQEAGIDWAVACALEELELQARLGCAPVPVRARLAPPDWAWVHQELKKKGVTLTLLWEEYRESSNDPAYRYSRFCELYGRWRASLKRSMRQVHRAGEKLFIDYAGPTVPVIDQQTGEVRFAQIFVAALGASNYSFAYATWTQTTADWLAALAKALAFIGGVTELIVPDNTRALIGDANRYEPMPNRSACEFAAHYSTVILPARPYRPRDKAKVEFAVQLVERWILARLRHRQFFSLEELNRAIADLLVELNERAFKKLPGSRRSAFETLDKPALKPLPTSPYQYAEWRPARANIDYHIEIEHHYYSVPHALCRELIDVRLSATTLECFYRSKRIATHARSWVRAGYSTIAEHMPASHRAHREWSPGRLLTWAASVGVRTRDLVRALLESRPHPEQGYRACLGLMRLGNDYGRGRLEAACGRALAIGAPRYKSVAAILKAGLDRVAAPAKDTSVDLSLPLHHNVRGPTYYH